MKSTVWTTPQTDRRALIGGSDARNIMGDDEAALVRLWREKRGEAAPEDLSGNLIVQLGTVTEDLNRRWYERNTGQAIKHVQRRVQHPVNKWMAATLDGMVDPGGAVFEDKFMLPWTFSEEAAAEKHMAQLQHNMWVADSRSAVLSIITGGGKWALLAQAVEAEVADFLGKHSELKTTDGHQRVVRHGHLPEREVMTGIGPVAVRQPRVRDREAGATDPDRIRFSPSILPPYMRRSKSIETLLPILYLRGSRPATSPRRWRRCWARTLPGCRHPPSAA